MRHVVQKILIVSLLVTLIACGTPANKPPVVEPPIDQTPIKSAFGTPVGSAVAQTLDAAGGTFDEPTTGVTVKALAGGFDASTQLSVQPITNTLPGGIGMGVAISSSQPFKKPLIVRFGYGADEPDPHSLRLALQADDGSWFSLSPVKIDTVNRTVSAAVPESLTTVAGASGQVKPQGGLNVKRVVKYLSFYLKPGSATLKTGKSADFVPWARVLEKKNGCKEIVDGLDEELASLPCPKPIIKDYPFTNDKTGFGRTWSVNGVVGGDSKNGMIEAKASVGATYTAPETAPSPNKVTLSFETTNTETKQKLIVLAAVTILGNNYEVVGNYTASQFPVCRDGAADLRDQVKFVLARTPDGEFNVKEIQNQTTQQTNFQSTADPGTATSTAPVEVFTLTDGIVDFDVAPTNTRVDLDGKGSTGGCNTVYPPGGGLQFPPYDEPSLPIPVFLDFSFNDSAFINNTQKVVGVGSHSIFGTWELTITRQ